jgi:hypothetical protein
MAINFANIVQLPSALLDLGFGRQLAERFRLPPHQEALLDSLIRHVEEADRGLSLNGRHGQGWKRESLNNDTTSGGMSFICVTYRLFTHEYEFRVWEGFATSRTNGYGLSIRARADELPVLKLCPSATAKSLFAQLKFAEGIPWYVGLRA